MKKTINEQRFMNIQAIVIIISIVCIIANCYLDLMLYKNSAILVFPTLILIIIYFFNILYATINKVSGYIKVYLFFWALGILYYPFWILMKHIGVIITNPNVFFFHAIMGYGLVCFDYIKINYSIIIPISSAMFFVTGIVAYLCGMYSLRKES